MMGHGDGALLQHVGSVATNAIQGLHLPKWSREHTSMSRSSSVPQLQSLWQ